MKRQTPSSADSLQAIGVGFAGSGFGSIGAVLRATGVVAIAGAGYVAPVIGLPIMREGFITETGLMPPSSSSTTSLV